MQNKRNYYVKPSIFYKIANKLILLLFLVILCTGFWVVMTFSAKWLYELTTILGSQIVSSLTRRGLEVATKRVVTFFSAKDSASRVPD